MASNPIESESMPLTPGDTFVLFSDGVSEAMDLQEDFFGEDRLLATLADRAGAPTADIVDGVMERRADVCDRRETVGRHHRPRRPIRGGVEVKVLVVALVLLLPIRAAAQDASAERIDAYVRDEMARQQIPGIAVAVVRNGTIVLARGYGLANVEHQVPVKPETVFQSGSVGKQFTATAVMRLVEQGRVSLDDRITKYLPEGAPRWNAIKVRHLLTHTGGTTDYPSNFDFRRDYTEGALVKRAAAIPLAFAPGTKWSYSNIGYLLLGVLIHRVTGEFYGDVLEEHIFEPLGMTTTRIISEADIVPNRAAGYRLVKGS